MLAQATSPSFSASFISLTVWFLMIALQASMPSEMWKLRFLASWRELADGVAHDPLADRQIDALHLRFGASSPDSAASRLYFEARQQQRLADLS